MNYWTSWYPGHGSFTRRLKSIRSLASRLPCRIVDKDAASHATDKAGTATAVSAAQAMPATRATVGDDVRLLAPAVVNAPEMAVRGTVGPRQDQLTTNAQSLSHCGPASRRGWATSGRVGDMSEQRIVSAEREVSAPAEAIFKLIADPARQPDWDGNNNLASAEQGQRITGVDQSFTMELTNGQGRVNYVIECEEGRHRQSVE